MSTKRRWYEILLAGMVILLVLAAGTVRTANAWQYELDEEPYTYESDDYDRNTSTYVEFAEATATASNGECYCKTDTYTHAENDTAWADAEAYGIWMMDWTWNGPPESNPPGGSLDWDHDGGGYVFLNGSTGAEDPGQHALCASTADNSTWSTGTSISSVCGSGEAWGVVEDSDYGACGVSAEGVPSEDLEITDEDEIPNYGYYRADISWSFETSKIDSIASGTTLVQFYSVASCDAASFSGSSGGAMPRTTGYTHAEVTVSAEFP